MTVKKANLRGRVKNNSAIRTRDTLVLHSAAVAPLARRHRGVVGSPPRGQPAVVVDRQTNTIFTNTTWILS